MTKPARIETHGRQAIHHAKVLANHRLSMLRGMAVHPQFGSYSRINETSTLFASLYTTLKLVPLILQNNGTEKALHNARPCLTTHTKSIKYKCEMKYLPHCRFPLQIFIHKEDRCPLSTLIITELAGNARKIKEINFEYMG